MRWLAILATLCAFPALGQACFPAELLAEKLHAESGEMRMFTARTAGTPSLPVEITVGPAGDWTVMLMRPDGAACIVVGGEGFAPAEPRKPGRGS